MAGGNQGGCVSEIDLPTKADMGRRFGANLRRLRRDAGVSGEELAVALGLEGQSARNAISEIERGRLPNLHRAHRLAVALQVTLDDLVALPATEGDQRAVSPAAPAEKPTQPPTG